VCPGQKHGAHRYTWKSIRNSGVDKNLDPTWNIVDVEDTNVYDQAQNRPMNPFQQKQIEADVPVYRPDGPVYSIPWEELEKIPPSPPTEPPEPLVQLEEVMEDQEELEKEPQVPEKEKAEQQEMADPENASDTCVLKANLEQCGLFLCDVILTVLALPFPGCYSTAGEDTRAQR
jgi:hypothetical protein